MSNMVIISLIIVLTIYWFILLYRYDIEKKYNISEINEDELLKKYNPMVAGCFQGERDVLSRDIIAIILNLIDKGNIKLDFNNSLKENEKYIYFISRVIEKENELDEMEEIIYNWLFLRYI